MANAGNVRTVSIEKAAAMAGTSTLGDFEGDDVLQSGIEIPGAAGGLRDAMAVDPVRLSKDDEVFIVLRCTVAKVRFEPIKDTDALRRVHILAADEATFVDGDLVREHLAAQSDRIQRAKEAAAGVSRLEFVEDGDEDDEAEVLVRQHNVGAHLTPLAECPLCTPEPADPEPISG